MRGTVLTELAHLVSPRHSEQAITQRLDAHDHYDTDMARSLVLTMIMLAQNHALQGDLDLAARIGGEAVDLAHDLGSVRPKDRLAPLEKLLRERATDSETRDLLDRITRYRAEPP